MKLLSGRLARTCLVAVAAGVLAGAAYCAIVLARPNPAPTDSAPPPSPEATSEQVHTFCGACHAYPPPDVVPRAVWRQELRQAYDFFRGSNLRVDYPSLESVAQYYENRAPESFSILKPDPVAAACPVRLERSGFTPPDQVPYPGVTNVNLVHLFDERRLDVLVCDMRFGQVMALQPYVTQPKWRMLGSVSHPAHAEVIDLDGDGIKDILVANLGNFTPTNQKVGSVVWLRGRPDGSFTPITLLRGVGRVADVQAADFRGVGKLDLIVAAFGWRDTGEIVYLENQTTDWDHPKFEPRVVDDRHGTIHVPVADLNGDGKPDFVALISQEHETIVAFLNDGKGGFRKEVIHAAPHPAYGSSGIQLVDLNGDGKLDVLYTNGDALQLPYLLRPYHGVQWLENQGSFPFVHHPLAPMYGAMRAVAGDITGSGRPSVLAVSYLPAAHFPDRAYEHLDSVILLEQDAPGHFVRHSLETVTCDHMTCALGDVYGDGKLHLVTGNFTIDRQHAIPEAVTIWKNLGPEPPEKARQP
jgi:FG-GAP-like repeat/Dihaem cytochrome c